jgi:hypothetical protein
MAQHDYVIANGTGAAVRSDINNGLAAIVSNNSGATEPATMYAYQWWADTTTGLLKIRNAANNGWVTVGTLASANLGLLSSGSTITAALGNASTPGITFTGDTNTGIYSPGADQVAVATSGTGRLFIDSSGRALIGTSSASTATSAQYSRIQIVGHTGATEAPGRLVLRRNETSSNISLNEQIGQIFFGDNEAGEYALIECASEGTAGSGDYPGRIVLSTTADGASSPTERMRITSAGLVGIGTNSPSSLLHLVSSGQPTITVADDAGRSLQVKAPDSSANPGFIGTTTNHDFLLQAGTTAGGLNVMRFNTAGSERARIDSSGSFLVGCTSLPSASVKGNALLNHAGQGRLYVASNNTGAQDLAYWINPNGVVGTVTTNGTSTAYNTSSDYRLKENVTSVPNGITRLQQLKPSRFNFKADPNRTVDGFIAHEAQAVVPECVTGEKDAVDADGNPVYQGIDQSKLVPLLTAALQEAIAKIETLEAKVAALEGV